MAEVRIAAEARTEFGKGAARRVRRAQKVPAVLYGHGGDTRHVCLPGHELMLALKNPNVLLSVTIDGKDELALPRDVQRDPIKGFLEHVDLLVVRRGEKVRIQIGVHIVGEAVADSLVVTELNTLEVLAEATNIPESFTVDVTDRPIGSQVLAKEVELPAGVELVTDAEYLVVNIVPAPTADDLEAELEEAEAEAGIERDLSEDEEAAEAGEGDGEESESKGGPSSEES